MTHHQHERSGGGVLGALRRVVGNLLGPRRPDDERSQPVAIHDRPREPVEEGGEAAPAAEVAGTVKQMDLESKTKTELYERAQELEITGRSKMTKNELARAIARRSRQSGA